LTTLRERLTLTPCTLHHPITCGTSFLVGWCWRSSFLNVGPNTSLPLLTSPFLISLQNSRGLLLPSNKWNQNRWDL